MILQGMLAFGIVVFGWLLLWAVASGMGAGLLAMLCGRRNTGNDAFRAAWVGLAVIVLLAQFWNLVWPLSWPFGVACLLLAAPGLAVAIREVIAFVRAEEMKLTERWVLVLVLVWGAHRATAAPGHPDSMQYHLSAVRWYADHPIIVGLANLHDRLGYNNTSHFVHAVLERCGFAGRSFHVVNSFMAALVLGRIVVAGLRLWHGRTVGADRVLEVFYLLLLTPVIGVAISNNMSSPTTDWPGMAAAFVGTAELLRFALSQQERARSMQPLVAGLLCLSMSATFKLTHLPYAAIACLLGLGLCVKRLGMRGLFSRPVLVASGLCGVLIGLWAVRSVLLSGYVAYPQLPVSVPWRVPDEQCELNRWVTLASARGVLDLSAAGQSGWLESWIRWQFRSVNVGYTIMPAALIVGAVLALGVGLLGRKRVVGWSAAVLLIPLAVATLVWWGLAPQPRMGGFLLWTTAAVFVGVTAGLWMPVERRMGSKLLVIGCTVLGASPVAAWLGAAAMGKIMLDRSRSPIWVVPGLDSGLHPAPTAETQVVVTASGMRVFAPVDQLGCWDGPLPCTAFPSRQLALRTIRGVDGGMWTAPDALPAPEPSDVQRAWEILRREAKDGDRIYASPDAVRLVQSAQTSGELPAGIEIVAVPVQSSTLEMVRDICGLLGKGRVWYVHADGPLGPKVDELGSIIYAIDNMSEPIANYHGRRMSLILRKMLE